MDRPRRVTIDMAPHSWVKAVGYYQYRVSWLGGEVVNVLRVFEHDQLDLNLQCFDPHGTCQWFSVTSGIAHLGLLYYACVSEGGQGVQNTLRGSVVAYLDNT